VLATVRATYENLFVVGFAAETEKLEEHARGKLQRKGLDMIAANWVGGGRAFDQEDNSLHVYWADGGAQVLPQATKAQVARDLVALIVQHHSAKK
jgi:phosphopantothenoylcysteine decarboxylase/phosphopantothenate--cysteine ligase